MAEDKTYTYHGTCNNCKWDGPHLIEKGKLVENALCGNCQCQTLKIGGLNGVLRTSTIGSGGAVGPYSPTLVKTPSNIPNLVPSPTWQNVSTTTDGSYTIQPRPQTINRITA